MGGDRLPRCSAKTVFQHKASLGRRAPAEEPGLRGTQKWKLGSESLFPFTPYPVLSSFPPPYWVFPPRQTGVEAARIL